MHRERARAEVHPGPRRDRRGARPRAPLRYRFATAGPRVLSLAVLAVLYRLLLRWPLPAVSAVTLAVTGVLPVHTRAAHT
jgi:hypothetical protein